MSSTTLDTRISDYEYRQRIRRYTPSSLLPLIAATASRYRTRQEWLNSPYRIYTPWALADAARVALTHGTEFGRSQAADQDLARILDAYNRFNDPFHRDHDLWVYLLRKAGEQLTWQAGDYETLARTAAIFTQTPPAKPMECLLPGWDTELFGCSLREYVGTAQLVWASAFGCAGRFDLALFDTPDGQVMARHVGRDTVNRVLEAHFAISKDRFRAEDNKVAQRATGLDPQLRRFTYNPLRGRPVLTGFGAGYLCPVPQLAWAKATPWGVYFSGLDHFGSRFARDLGHLFEQYIGRQLQLMPDAQVIPEITCGPKARRRKTVDWIVVFSDLVLLVEVKSAIPTEPVRLGTPAAADEVIKKLGKAFSQIDITAKLIQDRDPALASVPTDRQILGIAVTLEPFHLANAPFLRGLLPATQTPVAVADAAEVESLVTITDIPAARLLRERAADAASSTWSLHAALQGHAHSRNLVLDEAWNSYPWASANRASRTAAISALRSQEKTLSSQETSAVVYAHQIADAALIATHARRWRLQTKDRSARPRSPCHAERGPVGPHKFREYCGQGRGRTADLLLSRRVLVPTDRRMRYGFGQSALALSRCSMMLAVSCLRVCKSRRSSANSRLYISWY